jgi:hypothetical protein
MKINCRFTNNHLYSNNVYLSRNYTVVTLPCVYYHNKINCRFIRKHSNFTNKHLYSYIIMYICRAIIIRTLRSLSIIMKAMPYTRIITISPQSHDNTTSHEDQDVVCTVALPQNHFAVILEPCISISSLISLSCCNTCFSFSYGMVIFIHVERQRGQYTTMVSNLKNK